MVGIGQYAMSSSTFDEAIRSVTAFFSLVYGADKSPRFNETSVRLGNLLQYRGMTEAEHRALPRKIDMDKALGRFERTRVGRRSSLPPRDRPRS